MASVKGRMVQWICPVTRKRKTKTLGSPALAKRFAADRENETDLVRGRFITAQQLQQGKLQQTPIRDAIDGYKRALEKRGGRAAHRKVVLRSIELVVEACRWGTVADISSHALDRFLQELVSQGKSARTHNHYLSTTRGFCKWLSDHEYIEKNPARVIRPLDESKDKRRPTRALSVGEIDALLNVSGPRRLLYLLRLRTGLRGSECRRLIWSDLDLKAKTLHLRSAVTKNGSGGMLPLADDLCEELVAVMATPRAPVFKSTPSRLTWKRDLERARGAWIKSAPNEHEKALRQQGDFLEYVTTAGQVDPKCLRNTFESLLIHGGAEAAIITLMMRHTPAGGMKLTLGTYGDPEGLLKKQRQALAKAVTWQARERARMAKNGPNPGRIAAPEQRSELGHAQVAV